MADDSALVALRAERDRLLESNPILAHRLDQAVCRVEAAQAAQKEADVLLETVTAAQGDRRAEAGKSCSSF